MHQTLHRIAYAALLSACAIAAPAPAADNVCALPSAQAHVATLSWLNGNWIEHRNGQTARERWSGPYGGALLGVGVTTKGNSTKSFEFFRVAKSADGITYFASPNAAPVVEFKAIELCSTRVVFENKTHDFPERVIYTKGPNGTLNARIEGVIDGKQVSEDWHYRREK